jgi:Flp pilus assembly protein TadG
MIGRRRRVAPGRGTDDRGSILVEFALLVPVLISLLLGVTEYGLAWKNDDVLASSLRAAVRTAAQAGGQPSTAPQADRLALEAYVGSMGQAKRMATQKVVIYQINSSNSNGRVPAACLDPANEAAGGVNTATVKCNIYTAADLANLAASNFGCGSGRWDNSFCPTNRSRSLTGSGPEQFGIYAAARYTALTRLIPGSSMTMTDYAAGRVEASP